MGMAAAMGATAHAAGATARETYELMRLDVDTDAQRDALLTFFRDVAIPALNRLESKPVGLFRTPDAPGPLFVLIPYGSANAFAGTLERLMQDEHFVNDGASIHNAPADAPAYTNIHIALLAAIAGMPKIELPVTSPGRVVQLRIYESPSFPAGQKKIEMFNLHELALFRKVGLNPVFFGEALAGDKLPNLTYMLMFESREEQDAAWKRFVNSEEWNKLKNIPEYMDKVLIRHITNLNIVPAEGSQI